jgi:hypothetical protein
MDSQELRGLVGAYSEVYAPQEELDEVSYSAKAARAGKDIGKPGKMFAKIAKSAAKRYGSEERGKKVAGSVLAKLRSEEIEVLEDMLDEAVKGASRHDTEMRKAAASERRSGVKNRLSASAGKANADKMERDVKYMDKLTKNNKIIVGMAHEEVGQVDEAITSEKGKAKAAEMIANRSTPSGRAKSGQGASVAAIKHISRANVDNLGGTPPNLKIAKNPVKSRSYGGTGNKAARRAAALKNEEVDIFDVVLEFLQVEGFAETLEEAEWMMANVIDEEAIAIVLGEAQTARENPEKYEREQNKKYAPVRGERTPMPPRGDKRREDFEKWYAANVR